MDRVHIIPAFMLVLVLFLIGLFLSAFFSGNETGFYRLSFVRLNIDAQSGDRVTQKLLWFARNPSYFVATTLIGNNVANYLTTLSIGMATLSLFPSDSGWIEIVGTLMSESRNDEKRSSLSLRSM